MGVFLCLWYNNSIQNKLMKITKLTWIYVIAALITLYGIVTRQFIFLLLSFPLGIYYYTKDNNKDNE